MSTLTNKHLVNHRLGRQHTIPQALIVHWDISPAQYLLAFSFGKLQDTVFGSGARLGILRQKHMTNRISPKCRQCKIKHSAEKGIG